MIMKWRNYLTLFQDEDRTRDFVIKFYHMFRYSYISNNLSQFIEWQKSNVYFCLFSLLLIAIRINSCLATLDASFGTWKMIQTINEKTITYSASTIRVLNHRTAKEQDFPLTQVWVFWCRLSIVRCKYITAQVPTTFYKWKCKFQYWICSLSN